LSSTSITTILFDWGDTLMLDFPQFSGPMAGWPRVELVPGVRETLAALSPGYNLVLATNAAESGEDLVRAALRRVDLEPYFARVFTARELGSRKPDPAFFRAILTELRLAPGQALMVGDSFPIDVAGAVQAGLPAVWYTRQGQPSPGEPVHAAEIRALPELPTALSNLDLPTIQECLDWMEKEQAPANLLAHVRAVAGAAYTLAVWLREAGQPVDPILTHRGGLLHDLDKLSSRQTGERHGERSARLLRARGQPALAEIARRHILSTLLDPAVSPATWEQKLVFYADKLVEGSQVGSLDRRLEALYTRYPQYAGQMRQAVPALQALETEICSLLSLTPQDLVARLTGASL